MAYWTIHEKTYKSMSIIRVNDSKVMFNCALQDWVSNTVSEADALGCNVVYPAYQKLSRNVCKRSHTLYSLGVKKMQLKKSFQDLMHLSENMGKISDWTDGTIDRC